MALRQLEVRERSRGELADTLRRRGIPDEAAAQVLDSLVRVELLDDARFARLWVESRRRTKGLSRRLLSMELRQKGIGPQDSEAALAEVDEDSDDDLARRVAGRKAGSLTGVAPEVAIRRVAGQLARKGFSSATAYSAANVAVRDAAAALAADELAGGA